MKNNIEIWGQRRERYLKEHLSGIYSVMILKGELESHLTEVDKQASEMFDLLVRQMADKEGITEQLKAVNQMAWVGAMNNIENRAREIVFDEVICDGMLK